MVMQTSLKQECMVACRSSEWQSLARSSQSRACSSSTRWGALSANASSVDQLFWQ